MFAHSIDAEVELRLLQPQHADALFALIDANRAHIGEWLIWVDSTRTVNDTLQFIKSTLKQFADHDGSTFGIFYNGQLAGTIGFHYYDWRDSRTEIGYWLGAEFNGRGIMTRAVRALTTYALRELGLHRVEIWAAEGNHKSRAIPERLGYKLEGALRKRFRNDDVYHTMMIYGMLAEDWTA